MSTYHITVNISALRISVPSGAPSGAATEKTENKCSVESVKSDDDAEYVTASPRYTWSDEHVRSAKEDRLGEWLWPIVLSRYGLGRDAIRYEMFRRSALFLHPYRFPCVTLRDRMAWFIEEEGLEGVMRREEIRRRRMLRRAFMEADVPWIAEYVEVYGVWSAGCRVGMTRREKMEAFVEFVACVPKT